MVNSEQEVFESILCRIEELLLLFKSIKWHSSVSKIHNANALDFSVILQTKVSIQIQRHSFTVRQKERREQKAKRQ